MRSAVLGIVRFYILLLSGNGIHAQKNYTYEGLLECDKTTVEIGQLGRDQDIEPCIIFNIQQGTPNDALENSSKMAIVQVTPSGCGNHRDGAATGVRSLNADNDGKGVVMGFNKNHYVNFHLVSVVAGNPAVLSEEEYKRRHVMLLKSLLTSLEAPYIIGSCSFASSIEKQPALEHKAILMSQVGPPGFYTENNPYVFGFHINSDSYPLPSVQSLGFVAAGLEGGPSSIPVSVIARTKSEFFASTCRSAIDNLSKAGFSDLTEIHFDHAADHDEDGDINQFDEDFLIGLADQVCPPGSGDRDDFHPALFLCTLTEQDIILSRWLQNGCSPISLWATAATWGWATKNSDIVPYFQGGGQWHESFDYSDKYFESGKDVLNHNEEIFGYLGNYDQVVSYAIPNLFAVHLFQYYRVIDEPKPITDFADVEKRELLRRAMVVLTAETIFGPLSFNEFQRNTGRGAAGSQWLQTSGNDWFENALVSPLLQAQAQIVVPALNTIHCEAGSFRNETMLLDQGALLLPSCSSCPEDTFMNSPTKAKECLPCPTGSSTEDLETYEFCIIRDDNLLPTGMLVFGYIIVGITWMLSLGFIGWLLYYRDDPIVKVSQINFLSIICVGTIISSSTVVALSIQAGFGEDEGPASLGCLVAPWLYSIGWCMQYASLSAKTFRLFKVMKNSERARREVVGFWPMFRIVLLVLLVDITILICWTVLSPLMYERSEGKKSVDAESGMVVISSVGRCVASNEQYPPWYFAGPLIAFHFLIMITTNVLLYKVKGISDRYQEHKFVGMASILMFEILMVGVPVFIAVDDNPLATFVVILCFIALDDIGILCFIFVPKVMYQRKGLQEGVLFGETIMRKTYREASTREKDRVKAMSKDNLSSYTSYRSRYDSRAADTEDQGIAEVPAADTEDQGITDESAADTEDQGVAEESAADAEDQAEAVKRVSFAARNSGDS